MLPIYSLFNLSCPFSLIDSYETYMNTRKLGSRCFHCFSPQPDESHRGKSGSRILDKDARVPWPRCKIHRCIHIELDSTYSHPIHLPSAKHE